jgi:hypothetical protein
MARRLLHMGQTPRQRAKLMHHTPPGISPHAVSGLWRASGARRSRVPLRLVGVIVIMLGVGLVFWSDQGANKLEGHFFYAMGNNFLI